MSHQLVKLVLKRNGAYTVCAHDASSGAGAFVQHDGRNAMRVVGVTSYGFEERISRRRAVRGGVAVTTSLLRGDRERRLELQWLVTRPGLTRTETWKVSSGGRGTWSQVDVRPGRTTTYRVVGPGRYEGESRDRDGALLWTSAFQRDPGRGAHRKVFRSGGCRCRGRSIRRDRRR